MVKSWLKFKWNLYVSFAYGGIYTLVLFVIAIHATKLLPNEKNDKNGKEKPCCKKCCSRIGKWLKLVYKLKKIYSLGLIHFYVRHKCAHFLIFLG